MQNRNTKFSLLLIAFASIIALSSFTFTKKTPEIKKESTVLGTNWEEYDKVRKYVQENICEPIRKNSKNPSAGLKSFSRCPSGYQPRMAGATDSVNTQKYVTGKVTLYTGCKGQEVCDFKVYVEKNIALVKNKDAQEFVSVSEWLKQKTAAQKSEQDLSATEQKQVKG